MPKTAVDASDTAPHMIFLLIYVLYPYVNDINLVKCLVEINLSKVSWK